MEAERVVAAVLVRKPLESVWKHWTHREEEEEWRDGRHSETVIPFQLIGYVLGDGRKGCVEFQHIDSNTIVRESFEADPGSPPDRQRGRCQARLDGFKEYIEAL